MLSHGRHIKRTSELPVDQIPCPAQVREVGELLPVHAMTLPSTIRRTPLTCKMTSQDPELHPVEAARHAGNERVEHRPPAGRVSLSSGPQHELPEPHQPS